MRDEGKKPSPGVVTSRICPHCGHSEIGYTTPEGQFHALKPGTLIQVMEPQDPLVPGIGERPILDDLAAETEACQEKYRAWVPDALKGDKRLRLKYGVMIREEIVSKGIKPVDYQSAFLSKIGKLVEKEVHTPLPVILDRFFSAPHLASGNPRQISHAIWREIEEIRKPVLLVGEWLEKQDPESLSKMIQPLEEPDGKPLSDEDIEAELQSLSLEEFFETL